MDLMWTFPVRKRTAFACLAIVFTISPYFTAHAQDDKAPADASQTGKTKTPPPDKSAADKQALPPLPADIHVTQSMQLDGKTLHYTVTVGKFPVRDAEGKVTGEVVSTAYTVDQSDRRQSNARHGRSHPRRCQGISRRSHVLYPAL
ncbi:MAG TPA: hypothetical protein VMF56_14935 [Acidobacteriaceae bacterium]|nr:hypothetical protein [Acidobacteriaceae bacterium]